VGEGAGKKLANCSHFRNITSGGGAVAKKEMVRLRLERGKSRRKIVRSFKKKSGHPWPSGFAEVIANFREGVRLGRVKWNGAWGLKLLDNEREGGLILITTSDSREPSGWSFIQKKGDRRCSGVVDEKLTKKSANREGEPSESGRRP